MDASRGIDHSRKYDNIPLCSLFVTPKFCISIVFSFSWGHFNSQEKLKTKHMQNYGVTNKKQYGMLWYFLEWSIGLHQTFDVINDVFLVIFSLTKSNGGKGSSKLHTCSPMTSFFNLQSKSNIWSTTFTPSKLKPKRQLHMVIYKKTVILRTWTSYQRARWSRAEEPNLHKS